MAKKVQYIKIARIDQNGNDLTNTLESLTQITIPLTTSGNKTYKILTRADFPTYYLFQVDLDDSPDAATQPNTTPTTLDYVFTGSMSTSTTTAILGAIPIPISASDNDNLGFFNSTTNTYDINTLPKKDITVQIQGNLTPVGSFFDTISVGIYKLRPNTTNFDNVVAGELISQTYNPNGFLTSINKTITIPKEDITPGDQLSIRMRKTAGFLNSYSVTFSSGAKFKVSSTAASGPTLENIVEPYLARKFVNSDCDVLINNVDQYQENPFLQDLDFSSGTIVPVNYDQIVAGTAQKATVPQSMFTMGGMINPNNSAVNQVDKYNISASSYFGQTSGGTFVAYYKRSVTSGTPGSGYTTNFIVDYLITPDEEAVQIKASDESLDLLRRNFGSNANPLDKEYYPFGPIDGEVKLRAIPISGSSTGSVFEYRGNTIVGTIGSVILVQSKTTGSEAPGDLGIGQAGIIYPASIELTSHANLPSKARQILTENNIIPPEN